MRSIRETSAVLPWVVAGASLAVAGGVWLGRDEVPNAPPPVVSDTSEAELRRLRLALATSASEAEALREELDRLLHLYRGSTRGEAAGSAAQPAAIAEPAGAPAGLDEAARTYRDALARVAAGDDAAVDEAYRAVTEVIRAGPAGFAPLRDLYLSTSDPRVRAQMVRAFVSTQGDEAREFVASQLRAETDPGVRLELAERAALMSGPAAAPVFRDAFLETIRSDESAELRRAAVRGLRHMRGDEAVEGALLQAASDPDAEVRAAAIENLALRPERRDDLRRLVETERNPSLREIGECRLLLAESPFGR